MAFDDLDDLDVDFDAADIQGRLLALVKTAAVKRNYKEDEGTTSTGVSVQFEIENDETFEGQSLFQYYWLGTKDESGRMIKKPNAQNVKAFKSFVTAVTGVEPEGNIKLSAYGPEQRTIGKKEETCLTDLEGSHVMINVDVRKGNDGVERSVVTSISAYNGSFDTDDEDEPY